MGGRVNAADRELHLIVELFGRGEAAAPVVAAKPRKSRKALADAKALVPHPPAAVDPGAKAAQPR